MPGTATLTANLVNELAVVADDLRALYGEFGLWVRPLSMFCEEIEVDGEHVPRFALIQAEVSPIGASQV